MRNVVNSSERFWGSFVKRKADWAATRAAQDVSDVLEAMWGYGDRSLRLSDAGRTPTSGARALARAALRASLS